MDAGEIDMEVTVKEKKEMVIQALTPDQQRGLLSDIKKQHPHMRVADLTQISWEVIEEDKVAGKPRVPPPGQSGSPPPQQQQQQSSGSGSQSSGSSGSGQQGQK
uniref:Uncharacterized protein n=1 Tax=Chromera velia CCMP2878 TaxID=1169474 RepID=A0A0G4HHT6_9ALVE|eukprot:Cvel_27706.t1-p1 / transcript=Cvel_27706.t1 / gene=Cvel_27706 / organism=Chromera_velia_CCMP2878 / gene_product=hypothetical protein / transcript_product=hypothetical protein / location=Cvel_scaffold3500:6679-7134(+) / protein_length=103 / sequence_SO=supercontig / SO=protein_coding / is_pseudo=false